MSVTEEASATATTASDAAPGDTHNASGDEHSGMSLTGTPPLSDPAILAVNPKFRYDKEELLKLREAPLSQRKPDFLDVNEVSPTIWDPTRWNFDRKKSDTPTENGTRPGDGADHRRRPGDPCQRLRKENDGIVLSPQRRSFNSGCFVPVREPRANSNRPHSPLGGKSENSSHLGGGGGVREIQSNSRRIGSGRILWDFGEKQEGGENDYSFRPQQRSVETQERRSFGRDFDVGRDKEKERRNGRYSDRRRISGGNESREDEPEWFSGGPSSQNDTIELRGFDDSERLSKKKMSPSQAKRARDWFKKKSEVASVTEEKDEVAIEPGPGGRSTPTPQAGEGAQAEKNEKKSESGTTGGAPAPSGGGESSAAGEGGDGKANAEKNLNDQSYIFEDILKCDTIPGLPGLLTNGVGGDGDANGKSRFSKWFSVENTNMSESRRSSIQEEAIIKNLLKDLNEPSVSIPGDSSSYFAPISPAANTGTNLSNAGTGPNKSINIMEMLQRGKQNESAIKTNQVPGRIMNLNELEAKMRQNSEPQMHKHAQKSEEDMSAFNRLLAHISVNNTATSNGPIPQKSQPMSLMEMLSHSQQQDEARMAQLLGPPSPGASPHDLAARLQHVQNHQQQKQQQVEMLTKLMNAGMQVRASPLPEMGIQQSRELLSRPEAQAILQGLKIGDITPQHLYQQLANPALQPRHREMLVTILKLQGGGVGPSPRVLSPVAPHPMFQQQQQQQQLRVSPLPPNAYCVSPIMATSPNTLTVPALHQRIPSPRELQVHTQNILQRALIKKKLEEQQENYRKKQEMQQRGQSPNNNNNNSSNSNNNTQQPAKSSVSSPTPLAFTPTSVLRKMTAEKDDGKDVAKLVEGGKLTQQGRAVTGMRPQTQQPQQQTQQQQPPQWPPFQMNMKQAGRPIVKANNFQAQQQQDQFFGQQQQQQQQKFLNQLQQQQQQQQQRKQYHGSMAGHHPQYPNANQQFSQLTQQQLRAQHQQHARPTSVQQQQQQYGNQQGSGSWQQFLNPQQSRGQVGRGGLNDGDLSPTSNQLTRWFSPDLLERARGGELPSTAGLSQHLLSLEEIERLTAPPVHN